jgi:hypothetical protein
MAVAGKIDLVAVEKYTNAFERIIQGYSNPIPTRGSVSFYETHPGACTPRSLYLESMNAQKSIKDLIACPLPMSADGPEPNHGQCTDR